MTDINISSFSGRLARDPYFKDGESYKLCKFTIASEHGYKDKKRTEWVQATIWGKQADVAANMLVKGMYVFISGELSLEEYTSKDGNKKAQLALSCNSWQILPNQKKKDEGGGADAFGDATPKAERGDADDKQAEFDTGDIAF